MTHQSVMLFFKAYEKRVNQALSEHPEVDVDGTAAAYTNCFIEAHSQGTICFKNDEEFRKAVPNLFESQRKLGTKSMTIAQITPTTLDDIHTMVKIHWKVVYLKSDQQEVSVEFDEIYMVQTIDEKPKIFAYIAGDQEQLLKSKGIT